MKKTTFLLVFFVALTSAFAQDESADDTLKELWSKSGNVSLLFNQSAFSNWVAGGQNSVSGTLGINYDFNYLKGDWAWDNKLIVAYGITKLKGQKSQKTDDRLDFNSILGKKAANNWYFSMFFNGKTQMDVGYNPDSGLEVSHGFSPLYLQLGPGMLWKKSDNLKVNIAPGTSRVIIVHDHFTELGESFGVAQGKTTRYELGASIGAYYKLNLMENVSLENILNLYSDYLENPQNVDLDYTMNLVMTINKYLSANLAFQTIYDDNAYKGFQTREVFGVSVNFGF